MSSKTSYGLTFYINRTKQKKNGECPVMLRININGQRVVLQTKRYLFPQDWDPNRYQMKGRTTEARVFNDYLEALRIKAHQKYNELFIMNDDVTPQMLRDAILGINSSKTKMIIEVWNDYIEQLRQLIGKENTYTTYQKYNTAKNHFTAFLISKYGIKDISIKAIDFNLIQKYSLYLKTEKHSSYNTATKFLQNLKRVTRICLKNGWLQKDPFASISLKLKEVNRPYLTNEELMKLMEFNSPFERLSRVCDLFIFSCFTGLSYIDIKKLKRIEIEGNAEYGLWIRTRRQKTGSRANIPILKMAKVILDKYCDINSLNPEDSVLPVLSN